METVTGGLCSAQSRPGGLSANTSLTWKKTPPEPLTEDPKPSFGKVSQVIERSRSRSDSPSRVSLLLEAWEKGLVGTETADSASSADTLRSRFPERTGSRLSSKDSPSILFAENGRTPLSSKHNSQPLSAEGSRQPFSSGENRCSSFPAGARRSRSPADTRRSLSPADCRPTLFQAEGRTSRPPENTKQSPSAADTSPPSSADARRSRSPAVIRHCASAADTRSSFSPEERRRPRSPASKRHFQADLRQSFRSAETQRSLSPAATKRSGSLADAQCPSSSTVVWHSHSPRQRQDVLSSGNHHNWTSLADTRHSSSLPDVKGQYSVADIRRIYSVADASSSSSPAGARCSPSPASARRSSSPADARRSSYPVDVRHASSPASARRSTSPEDARCSSSPAGTRDLFYSAETRSSASSADARRSSSPTGARNCSPTSGGGRSRSLSPRRESMAHGPVFAQVYTPASKSKGLKGTEIQEMNSSPIARPQAENGYSDATDPAGNAELQGENLVPSTDASWGETVPPIALSNRGAESQKESHLVNDASASPSAGSMRDSQLHRDTAFRGQTENSLSRNANSPSFSASVGGSYATNTPNAKPCLLSPVPQVLSSSTVAKSQPPWFGSKGGNMVIFRTQQQVIVPQAGTTTVYRAGREIVMSTSGAGIANQAQQDRCHMLNATHFIQSVENQEAQNDLTSAESPIERHAFLPDACSCHVTQSKIASVDDAREQRRMLAPNPSFTSSTDAVTSGEKDAAFSSFHGDTDLQRKPTFQGHSSLMAEKRSEEDKDTTDLGGKALKGSERQNNLSEMEMVHSSRSQRVLQSCDASGDIGKCAISAGSQEAVPEEQIELNGLAKDSLGDVQEPLVPPPEMSSSNDPPSQKKGSRPLEDNQEEVVDMELFVDTLRNMEPPEPRKPLKLPQRPPRPSTFAKQMCLPPIHEDHVIPKSKPPLPGALGQLFNLTEEATESKVEDVGPVEEDTEEIENPYLTKDEKSEDNRQAKNTYPWENSQFKTEEEIGSFLEKLKQDCVDARSKVTIPKAVANQSNLIRANILKGISLLSGLADKKPPEDKPYSRLDNSLLYSRFIIPQKSQIKERGEEEKSSVMPLISVVQNVNREYQVPPNGPWSKAFKLPTKINVRPGKIILYSEAGFGGQKREIWGDIMDATSWEFSPTISIRVVRGGWVMYEKPRFHGRKCVLAEGDVEITNPWRLCNKNGDAVENVPFHIGSLKRVVRVSSTGCYWSLYFSPALGFLPHPAPLTCSTTAFNSDKLFTFLSIHPRWLVYSKPFFDDDPYVLEPGGYPSLQAWGAKDPSICSLHPIKMGCPVVEKPGEPKALIYEKPHFQGHSWEVSRDIYNLKKPENNQDSQMATAGSMKILGGCWVGYEKEGFRGHQYLLEEGEYGDWTQWGGYNEELVSLRLIRTDFLDPAIVLFEAMDFEDGPSVELSEALPDVELANYGTTTQSIHVLSGVWLAYEGKNFTGEQYILEKGVYRNCEDWGANDCQISSLQPIVQVGEHSLHFVSQIQLFSDPDFLGNCMAFKEDQASLPENFIPRSCRLNGGSWILYDSDQFSGEQHVLSEGEYPTLTSMGCLFTTAICSLKKVPIFFSEPSIFLHGLECFEGKEIELNSEVRSLQAEGFNNHVLSVRVKGGIWVLCEHSDFRGRQWLLDCMEITNWLTYSGLQHIGSLYPIKQRRIYFRIKNAELKSFLSVPDDVEDMKAGRVLVSELSDYSSSIWYYEEGLVKNQVAPNMSLQVIGPAGKGAKVVLWSDTRVPRQTWRIDSFGRICSQMFEDRVLDVKGGRAYDRDHVVLWDSAEERPTQIWDVQVL
uniref:Crystallin beta-gamma domain containing 2 n=1 Tax=Salvator merianae TaxID=96440 RepID=A0A8D0B5K3_SALMN